jgi:hypothetical protein
MMRTGTVLLGAGALAAVLGATVIKSRPEEYRICQDLQRDFGVGGDCDDLKETNMALIAGGAAVAAVGGVLLGMGATRKNVMIGVTPGRISAGWRTSF